MNDILTTYNVSRETLAKLKAYEALVLEWNNKFNLISKSSAENIWERHILDSLQLCRFISSKDKSLYDFGSGAGFPAIVLAIASEQLFPDMKIHLVESIGKKITFLNTVKTELQLNVEIIQARIENLKIKNIDIITSRALASLPKLLEYSKPFCHKRTKLIFPKGASWEEELKAASEKWIFNYEIVSSQTDENSRVLCIKDVRRK